MNVSRRHFFLGSLALPAFAAQKPLGEKPNVLLILADGLPAWILGCYGNREVRTPQIDRLAQIGTRFLNHYACAPVADKARATLLTGRTTMQLKDAGQVTLDNLLGGHRVRLRYQRGRCRSRQVHRRADLPPSPSF